MSESSVQRVGARRTWTRDGVAWEMASEYEGEEGAGIIGLDVEPSGHGRVFGVGERTGGQGAECRDGVLLFPAGRVEPRGFEYERQGTVSLRGALNGGTGEVGGETAARRTSLEFVGFLGEVVGTGVWEEKNHVVL